LFTHVRDYGQPVISVKKYCTPAFGGQLQGLGGVKTNIKEITSIRKRDLVLAGSDLASIRPVC